jgi:hypothetical protein
MRMSPLLEMIDKKFHIKTMTIKKKRSHHISQADQKLLSTWTKAHPKPTYRPTTFAEGEYNTILKTVTKRRSQTDPLYVNGTGATEYSPSSDFWRTATESTSPAPTASPTSPSKAPTMTPSSRPTTPTNSPITAPKIQIPHHRQGASSTQLSKRYLARQAARQAAHQAVLDRVAKALRTIKYSKEPTHFPTLFPTNSFSPTPQPTSHPTDSDAPTSNPTATPTYADNPMGGAPSQDDDDGADDGAAFHKKGHNLAAEQVQALMRSEKQTSASDATDRPVLLSLKREDDDDDANR